MVVELLPTIHLASSCIFRADIGPISAYETGFFVVGGCRLTAG